MNHKVIGAYA
jgi:acyl-CoA oxidase